MKSDCIHPPNRSRYLQAMSLDAIEAMPGKATTPVILPTGAIEQHGPHLPVGVDSFLGQAWLDLTLPKLAPTTDCLVAPPILVGKSNEHTGFPGTLTIEKGVLADLIWSIARQLHTWGFRFLVVLNTHGGNIQIVRATLREIHADLRMFTGVLTPDFFPPVDAQETTFGFHAGELETSWMLALTPDLIDMTQAPCEYPARLEDDGDLRPEAAPAIFSWITADVSKSGTMGNATAATAAKGQSWLEVGGSALARTLENLATWARENPLTEPNPRNHNFTTHHEAPS